MESRLPPEIWCCVMEVLSRESVVDVFNLALTGGRDIIEALKLFAQSIGRL